MNKLVVSIPTFNRKDIIIENIKQLDRMLSSLDWEIVFYVLDNHSEDRTFEELKTLKLKNKLIVEQNEQNIGLRGNICKILSTTPASDYVWLLGDDDYLNKDLQIVCDLLKKESPDFFIIGKYNQKTGLYHNRTEQLENLFMDSLWMSGCIFKWETLKKMPFHRYTECWYPHSLAMFNYAGLEDARIYYLYNPELICIKNQGTVSYANNILDVYGKSWVEMIFSLPYTFTYLEKIAVFQKRNKLSKMLGNKVLLSLRARGLFNVRELNDNLMYIRYFNNSPYIVLLLIAVFPKTLLKFARKTYAKLKGINLTVEG